VVPASVTVAAGQTTATFAVTTSAVSASTPATLTATLHGVSQSATLTITPPDLLSVSLSPTSVTGGSGSTGTVTLTSAAPSGGLSVTLSSDTVAATLPTSVAVPAGQTTAPFSVSTVAVGSVTTAHIAGALGSTTKSAPLTINPPGLVSLTVNPASVVGGNPATGTVTLSSPAPSGGLSIALASDTAAASVPASVAVASGQTTATFPITTSSVTAAAIAHLSGSLNGATATAALTVNPVACAAPTLSSLTVASTTGTITLSGPALPGGQVMGLSSSNAAVSVPPTVSIAPGQTNAMFPLTVRPPPAPVTVTLTATYHGASVTATLTVDSYPQVPQGGSTAVMFPASGADGPAGTNYYGVDIVNPAGQVVAYNNYSAGSALNGWTFSDAGPSSTNRFSVQAPATAPVGVGYEIRSIYSGSAASAFFDVTPTGSTGSSGSGGGGGTGSTPPYLTADGLAQGFTLSTFCPIISVPSGIAVAPNGNVIVTSGYTGDSSGTRVAYIFPADTDNQNASQATTYPSQVAGMAVMGGVIYGTIPGQAVVIVSPDTGQPVQTVVNVSGLRSGIVVNPVNGHLIVAGTDILDIDPMADYTSRQPVTIIAGANVETVAISNDGQAVFGNGAMTWAWDISTGLMLPGFPLPYGSPDSDIDGGGFAVGGGSLSSKLFLNYASYNLTSQILEFDLTNPTATPLTIAQVPGRNDDWSTYAVSPDPNGSIFLLTNAVTSGGIPSGASEIIRLTPPRGGQFGVPAGQAIFTRD
ncbi:MAG: hypothetical protein M3Y35_18140, partial [Actinomycetota bacterium]|nr:hypothetical protein [Actinomycetota bacterium]